MYFNLKNNDRNDIAFRVETRSGHLGQPGHILSGSSGSDPLYKISGSDPNSALYHVRWCWPWWRWKCISQFRSRCFESGHWWRLYWKDMKGSRAISNRVNLAAPFRVGHRETRIKFNPTNTEWRLGSESCVAVCVCVKHSLQKKVICLQQVSLFNQVISGANPGLTRITIQVSGSSGSVVLTQFQPW